jgi:hypothetical protein
VKDEQVFWHQQLYSTLYPMAPLGGLFVATIGLFLILGTALPTLRMTLTYVGFAAGTLALILGGRLVVGLPAPSRLQVTSLVLAIALEIVMFVLLMPLARRQGERAVLVATLAIVSVHFLVMLPAFGTLIAVLGILCLLNAAIAWRNPSYSIDLAWFLDGGMKLGLGILLVMTSPLFA